MVLCLVSLELKESSSFTILLQKVVTELLLGASTGYGVLSTFTQYCLMAVLMLLIIIQSVLALLNCLLTVRVGRSLHNLSRFLTSLSNQSLHVKTATVDDKKYQQNDQVTSQADQGFDYFATMPTDRLSFHVPQGHVQSHENDQSGKGNNDN